MTVVCWHRFDHLTVSESAVSLVWWCSLTKQIWRFEPEMLEISSIFNWLRQWDLSLNCRRWYFAEGVSLIVALSISLAFLDNICLFVPPPNQVPFRVSIRTNQNWWDESLLIFRLFYLVDGDAMSFPLFSLYNPRYSNLHFHFLIRFLRLTSVEFRRDHSIEPKTNKSIIESNRFRTNLGAF